MTDFQSVGSRRSVSNWLANLTSSLSSSNTCPRHDHTKQSAMEGDDPFLWDIDRVVRELCTDHRTWPMKSPTQVLPEPVALERIIRDQGCDGATLLTEIDHDVLRRDFNLHTIGQRGTILHAIRALRTVSSGYANWIKSYLLAPVTHHYTPEPHVSLQSKSGPQHGTSDQSNITQTLLLVDGVSPSAGPASEESLVLPDPIESLDSHRSDCAGARRGISWITDSEGKKRRRLDLTKVGGDHELSNFNREESSNSLPSDEAQLEHLIDITQTGAVEQSEPGQQSKKRKRIAPTLVTSCIDPNRDREIPTEADTVIANDPQNVEPGLVYIGDDGRKRLVLVPQQNSDPAWSSKLQNRLLEGSQDTENEGQNGRQLGLAKAQDIIRIVNEKKLEQHSKSLAIGYLGKKKYTVDDIFYDDSGTGKLLMAAEVDEEICRYTATEISSGRRRYVNNRIKHFLRSGRQVTRRDNKYFSALLPYPGRLAPAHQSPSFTLLYATADGDINATREHLWKWPDLEPALNRIDNKKDIINDRRSDFNLPGDIILGGPNSYDNWDPSMLEKYRHAEGGDETLPLFGDSDTDGEYDYATMREIEEEFGTQERPLVQSQKRPLSREEINEAIDEGIAQMMLDWHRDKKPKRELGAWRLWMKSRRDATKRIQIRNCQLHLDRINNHRLPKIRKEFLEEVWTSSKQVLKQTRSMEQSIYDREDSLWRISVLESQNPPPKPNHVSIPKPQKVFDASKSNDGESIDTESDVESSDDGLADFVVNDRMENEQEEQSAADAEDEDLEISDLEAAGSDHYDGNEVTSYPVATNTVMWKSRRSKSDSLPQDCNGAIGSAEATPSDAMIIDLPANDGRADEAGVCPSMLLANVSDEWPTKLPENKSKVSFADRTVKYSNSPEVIDLTLLSSDTSGCEKSSALHKIIDLVTPEKPRPCSITVRPGGAIPILKFKPIIKPDLSPSEKSLVVDISDSEEAFEVKLPEDLPLLNDVTAIAKYPYSLWSQAGDRDRLIAAIVYKMKQSAKDDIQSLISSRSQSELWNGALEVMYACRDGEVKVRGVDHHTFVTLTGVIRLFEMYVDCQFRKPRRSLPQRVVQKLENSKGRFSPFHKLCSQVFQTLSSVKSYSDSVPKAENEEDDEEPVSAQRHRSRPITTSEEDAPQVEHTPHKTRKKSIFENAQARDLREQNQQRLKERESRRQILRLKLFESGTASNDDRSKIIINDGKFEDQGFVYVHEQIGKRIKSHQVEGIRFMWSQIVANGGLMQGCLLAHTMGLGKTMQVITLLVAITEAARSADDTVSSQIPESLKVPKTLILCPPGLIDNWMDELLTWIPDEVDLGSLQKVDSSVKPLEVRLEIIDTWFNDGGVLVLGYEMFRNLVLNKATAKREAPLDDNQHAQALEQLLQGPNIVIADEAHKMKNASASITNAASQFRTKSRIALTGSPLANNVEEYHTMVEWVAPNYLGPAVEFRAKYVEPIQQGLWHDSSAYERRKSMKMLGVLKEDLTPKVHRADMSVLRDHLMPKTEFVITVPLTDLQHKAYSIYVDSMTRVGTQLTKGGEVLQATLWHWLAILSLLCNHPECFRSKLMERKEDAQKVIEAGAKAKRLSLASDDDSIEEDFNVPVWKAGVSEDLIREEMDLFDKFGYTGAIENSNKVKILVQILDACRAARDKVLVFSQSIPTLNFLEGLCQRTGRNYSRLDGHTTMSKRQGLTKDFNINDTELYLISTTAGGLGLNLPGANRVIIFDFKFNPIMEEQAVGRAYRIGQKKPVFVYRFVAGGTFEDRVHNQAVFKMQLASRVVDKKNPVAWAKKKVGDFLFEPKAIEQQDLSNFRGMDPLVLDQILDRQDSESSIRAIVMTDTFERHDSDKLTAEEELEVQLLLKDEKLKRSDPGAYQALVLKRQTNEYLQNAQKQKAAAAAVALHMARPLVGSNQLESPHEQYIPHSATGYQSNDNSIIPPPRPFEAKHDTAFRMDGDHLGLPGIGGTAPTFTTVMTGLLADSMRGPVAGASTRVVDDSSQEDALSADVARPLPSLTGSSDVVGTQDSKTERRSAAPNGTNKTLTFSSSSAQSGQLPQRLNMRDEVNNETSNSAFPVPRRSNLSAATSRETSTEKMLRVAIRIGSRLGNYLLPHGQDLDKLLDDIVSSILKVMDRRLQNDPVLKETQTLRLVQSLKQDPQLCDNLLSGAISADKLATDILGPSPITDTPISNQDRKSPLNAALRQSINSTKNVNGGKLSSLAPSSVTSSPEPMLSNALANGCDMSNSSTQGMDDFVANFANNLSAALSHDDLSMEFIKSKANEVAVALAQKGVSATVFEAAKKAALHQAKRGSKTCLQLLRSEIRPKIFCIKLVEFVSKDIGSAEGESAGAAKFLGTRSLKTPLPKRNNPQKAFTTSPHAKADRAYLDKISAKRLSRSGGSPSSKISSVPASQNPKLPEWAISTIEEAKTRGPTAHRMPRADIYDLGSQT